VILISNLTLNIKDGSTIASTEIYGADKKTYVNIGSGNVFCLGWTFDSLPNDTLDYFHVVIKRYDPASNMYYDILSKYVGLVDKFYVNSDMLPATPMQYLLSIYIAAHGKNGSVITSNVINPYISKGSGSYVKVENGYKQPIMKRALAFAKDATASIVPGFGVLSQKASLRDINKLVLRDSLGRTLTATTGNAAENSIIALSDVDGLILQDIDEKILITSDSVDIVTKIETDLADRNGTTLVDAEGNALFAVATKLLNSVNGWNLVQESYTKDSTGSWRTNKIDYEVLLDETGEIITDENNEPIYVY
jgi:hypothetical protein